MSLAWQIATVSVFYFGCLFWIARWGDRCAGAGRSRITANVYALSLAVYCTSWTFFGSVGRASSGGLSFLAIYLGPTLMLMLPGILLKMIRISKTYRLTSIADFAAARYGKSQGLAGLVTVISVIGILPYIALQLKAIAASLDILFPEGHVSALPWVPDSTFLVTLVLIAFSLLFGTRHLDASERHEGMVLAIAAESLVKLLAFLAVGLFVTYGMFDGMTDVFERALQHPDLSALLSPQRIQPVSWFSLILLSALAILFLPRQFQVAVVENLDETHVTRAIWLFPLFLLLINIFVLPIALGGLLHFSGQGVNPDTYVLTLPLSQGQNGLLLLAFIGGLSAATSMVIVESIALSTMLCNDLFMPWLLRSAKFNGRPDISGLLLGIRRGAMIVILLLGYAYFRLAGEVHALVGIGLISFAAVAQFAPAILGGMYWTQGSRQGALVGLSAGFVVWLYTLLLPAFAKSGWLPMSFVHLGPAELTWLKPQALFGLEGLDEITHCLWWSLLFNAGGYMLVSVFSRQSALEVGQADRFVHVYRRAAREGEVRLWRGRASRQAVYQLLIRFLGEARARQQCAHFAARLGVQDWQDLPEDGAFVQFAEVELAGAIGSASARLMLASVVEEEPLGIEEVLDILDEASQVRRYSQALEAKSADLEAATQELRAANAQLRELDRMKDDFVSTVSHELRTPLTSIRAFSEMLYDDPKMGLADRHRFLGVIVSEAERLTRLINQILDLAKLESGRADWCTTELMLDELIRDSLQRVEALFATHGVQLSSDLPAGLPPILADRDRLTQVMINLLSNAVKFVPAGAGQVVVSLSRQGDFLQVVVADNGPGLTEEESRYIFEKFRQGGNTLTDKPQGTGLGLPISRQIVNHLGGQLWVESTPGTGARFMFTLPLVPGIDN